MLCKWNHTYNLRGLTFYTQHHCLEVHPSRCTSQGLAPFYCWIVFHGIMDPLRDIWSISSRWLLGIKLLWTVVYRVYVNRSFISLGPDAQEYITRLSVKCMCTFIRHCHTVLQSGRTIFHSHQQCVRDPGPPHPGQYLVLFLSFILAILTHA